MAHQQSFSYGCRLARALMFIHAAEHEFTSHRETFVNITVVQSNSNLPKFMPENERGPFGCLHLSCACEESVRLQVDKSGERDSTISLLQLSDCRLLTHISARMFPFTALLPFPAQQKCPTLFQFVVHRMFLPAVAVSSRSTFCMNNRYASSSTPWRPINADLH